MTSPNPTQAYQANYCDKFDQSRHPRQGRKKYDGKAALEEFERDAGFEQEMPKGAPTKGRGKAALTTAKWAKKSSTSYMDLPSLFEICCCFCCGETNTNITPFSKKCFDMLLNTVRPWH